MRTSVTESDPTTQPTTDASPRKRTRRARVEVPNPIFADTRTAAGHTGMTVEYLERARAQGIGPKFHRVGRRVVYKISDVVEWIESGRAADEHIAKTPSSKAGGQ
jgi:hypothetical protein